MEPTNRFRHKQNFSEVFPDARFRFSVLGPRFSLDPQVVDSVFPPAGSLGDHSNVLPHVVINRSTLPWERTAVSIKKEDSEKLKKEKKRLSWLVLLLFEEGELLPVPAAQKTSEEGLKTFSVRELRDPTTGKVKWPGIPKESGDHDGDSLLVIDVPWSLLRQIIPAGDDLRFLTHVRRTQEATGKPGEDEFAVIIGTRVPKPGSISSVHLVSVEGRYKYEHDQLVFDQQGAQEGDSIRLVSLKSWRFTCANERHNFTGLLRHLDRSSALRLPDPEHTDVAAPVIEFAKRQLAMGCVPLPHAMRQGNKTVSWYRGPLVPGNNMTAEFGCSLFSVGDFMDLPAFVAKLRTQDPISKYLWNQFSASTQEVLTSATSTPEEQKLALVQALDNILKGVLIYETVRFAGVALSPETLALRSQNPKGKDLIRLNRLLLEDAYPLEIAKSRSLPIRAADELIYYDDAYGMFDVSYAAAWELGRLLALQSKSFSVSLYHWKRSHARKLKDADTQLTHLPFDGPSADLELPEAVSSWFENLTLLEGVPFHYLVPDERMLPVESIRFFQLDPIWVECLVDGAFSIGRVLQYDHEQDQSQKESHISKLLPKQVSGFLIRSDVVAGWPGLQVDGYDEPIRGSSLFSVGDFMDLPAFVAKLRTQDPISKYLWNQFSASTQEVLTSATSTPEQQKLALVQALDNILKGVLIYETVRFAGVALSPETLALRSQNPKGKDLIRLNRLLLEDAYPLEIAKSHFAPEKTLLFEIDPVDAVSDLNKKKISARLEQRFQESKSDLSKEECTIECRQWLIGNGDQQFLLSKRENNEVDVCSAADAKYLFSIDGGFETDLNEGKISTDLRQAFRDHDVALRQDSYVSIVSWFISDSEHQKHYLIESEEKRLKVYRDYRLPLLRMARLSANILICLFEGVVQTVDLHLKPESLHFGLDKPDGDHKGFHKKLKDLAGNRAGPIDPIPWRDQSKQVIEVAALAKKIQEA